MTQPLFQPLQRLLGVLLDDGLDTFLGSETLGHFIQDLHQNVEVIRAELSHKIALRHDDEAIRAGQGRLIALRPWRIDQILSDQGKVLKQVLPQLISNKRVAVVKIQGL
jgi:hypothetical protein